MRPAVLCLLSWWLLVSRGARRAQPAVGSVVDGLLPEAWAAYRAATEAHACWRALVRDGTHVSHQTIVTTRLLPLLPMQQPAQLARRRREQEELEGGAGKRWGMCVPARGPAGRCLQGAVQQLKKQRRGYLQRRSSRLQSLISASNLVHCPNPILCSGSRSSKTT